MGTMAKVHEYLKNELTEAEMQVISNHINGCEHCEGEYDFEVLLNSVVQRSCAETPSAELVERVRKAMLDQVAKAKN
jgi:mycothiol system anti-sigma-R factor